MKSVLPAKAGVSSRLSELLLHRSVVGDGLNNPFPPSPGLVFSSATPDGSHSELKEAESQFLLWHELQMKPLRDELEMLKVQLEMSPSQAKTINAAMKAVDERLSKIPYPTWRDVDSHKSTLIDLMRQSCYNALSFVDEYAVKLAEVSSSPILASRYFGWVSLTGRTSDSTLIRSSATGGANIHSLAGDTKPQFNHFSSVSSGRAETLITGTLKARCSEPVRGRVMVIPGESCSSNTITSSDLLVTLKRVFSKGGTEQKVNVTFDTPALKASWDRFIQWDVDMYSPGRVTDSKQKALKEMPASLQTIALFASQAALVGATIKAANAAEAEGKHETVVVLTQADLDDAMEFAKCVFDATSGFDRLDAKAATIETAREAFKSPERIVKAEAALYEAITSAPEKKLAHTAAIRLPGVTAGLLKLLVARDHRFTELKGADTIRMGKTSRAYILKEHSAMTPEEANLELEQAEAEWAECPECFSESEIRSTFLTLQALVARRRIDQGYAVIPIGDMTSEQIRMVPAIVTTYGDEVCLRGTTDNPEPECLLVADDDEPAVFDGLTPNLWFRYSKHQEDNNNWTIASMLGFAEAWGKPLGVVEYEKENTTETTTT